jgi:hypothetical protein
MAQKQKPAPRTLRDLIARPGTRQSTATILENQASAVQRPRAVEQNYPSDYTPIEGSAITKKEKQLHDEAQDDSTERLARWDDGTMGPKQQRAIEFTDRARGVSRKDAQDVNLPYEGSVQDQQAQAAKQRRRKQTRIPQRLRDLAGTA